MDLSDAALSALAPDAVRTDLRVAARGRVLFCVPVTKCVLIFAVEEAGSGRAPEGDDEGGATDGGASNGGNGGPRR